MTETALKPRNIDPFADGVIIHNSYQASFGMISLEKKGAFFLSENTSWPLGLPSLAQYLAEWWRGFQSPIDGHALGPEYAHETGYNYSATFRNPYNSSYINFTEKEIKYWDSAKAGLFWPITIPEAAEILKGWYS